MTVAACTVIQTINPPYEPDMKSFKTRKTLMLLLACCATASADHRPGYEWSWHILSAGADESRISLYQRDQLFGIYDIACDLTDASEGESVNGSASLNVVKPDSNPEGLLVISCNLGAHSQQIAIIDLLRGPKQAAFTATGSFSASWEIQDGELWIGYDEPCDTGPTVDCPDGFKTTFVQYPQPAPESAN
jgi:hypothetical protein